MCAGAAIAWYQLATLRQEQTSRWENERAWNTLKACEQYDRDPVLDSALKRIREGRQDDELEAHPEKFTLEMSTVLNFLEGIVIGVKQGFYKEDVVRDHMEWIIRDHVREFLSPPMAKAMGVEIDYYEQLKSIIAKWDADSGPAFRFLGGRNG